ncbi:hypothetical protein [Lysinibacillus sp. CTST325]
MAPKKPTETYLWLIHPENRNLQIDTWREWRVLDGLPDETGVEAYREASRTIKKARNDRKEAAKHKRKPRTE